MNTHYSWCIFLRVTCNTYISCETAKALPGIILSSGPSMRAVKRSVVGSANNYLKLHFKKQFTLNISHKDSIDNKKSDQVRYVVQENLCPVGTL